MGNSIQTCFGKRDFKVFLFGLDAAGKTTVLYKMKLGETVTTIPTIGFNVESVKGDRVQFVIWDAGLRSKARPLYRHYLPNTDVLIYMIDSNDKERLQEVKDEVNEVLSHDDARDIPVLFLANKQDLPGSLSPEEIVKALGLNTLRRRKPMAILPTCATSGEGLEAAFHWVEDAVTCQSKDNEEVWHVIDTKYEVCVKETPKWTTYKGLISSFGTYAKSWLWKSDGKQLLKSSS